MKASVVLATYNESGNILNLIEEILNNISKTKFTPEVIVVDDNSPDGTAEKAKKIFQKDERVKIIVRKDERGLGSAAGRGFKESTGDDVIFMDADYSNPPKEIPGLLKFCDNHDLVSGSRHIEGGELKTSFFRKFAAKSMKIFMGSVLSLDMTDYTNGFFAVKKEALNKLDFDRIFYGYGDYYFRLYYLASLQGAKLNEVPSTY